MPHNDQHKTLSVFPHIEAVIIALHHLMAELHPISRLSDLSDDRQLNLLRLLSTHLGTEKAKLGKISARIEKHILNAKRHKFH